MAFQDAAAPTQWGLDCDSDVEGQAAMQAMDATTPTSHVVSNQAAASTAPWPLVLTVPAQLQLQHGNPQSLAPVGAPAATALSAAAWLPAVAAALGRA